VLKPKKPENPNGAKTEDFSNNMIIIDMRTSNLIQIYVDLWLNVAGHYCPFRRS
jgi:hypothetical protein